MKNLTCLLAATAIAVAATAPAAAQKMAFRPGEKLFYTASYSSSMLTTDVADITFATTAERLDNQPAYLVTARGTTRSFFNVFFTMDDVYKTWLDRNTLRPMLSTYELKEGGYRYNGRLQFNWLAMKVYTTGQNLKRTNKFTKTMALGASSYDGISLFFNMRNLDLGASAVGSKAQLSMVLIDTVRNIQYTFKGREQREVPNIGKVKCLKFSCQLATSDAESFQDGSEFLIWLTDDDNHIPVYLETPVRVGKVYVTLVAAQNLANPFNSLVTPR